MVGPSAARRLQFTSVLNRHVAGGAMKKLVAITLVACICTGISFGVYLGVAASRAERMRALNTQLLIAVNKYDITEVTQLLTKGADPNVRYRYEGVPSWEPMYRRLTRQSLLAVETPTTLEVLFGDPVVRRKPQPGRPWDYEWRPIPDPVALVSLLLQHGARPNDKLDGDAVVLLVAHYGFTDSLKLLLDSGADPYVVGRHGQNMMEEAISSDNPGTVKLLIQRGVDVNQRESNGETPLANAVRGHLPNIIEMLKQAGAK